MKIKLNSKCTGKRRWRERQRIMFSLLFFLVLGAEIIEPTAILANPSDKPLQISMVGCQKAARVYPESSDYKDALMTLETCLTYIHEDENNTILVEAIKGQKIKTVELVLKLGADPNRRYHYKQSMVEMAVTRGFNESILRKANDKDAIEIIKLLVKYGFKLDRASAPRSRAYYPYATWLAAKNGDLKTVQYFLDNGEDPYPTSEYNPYKEALANGYNDIAETIKKKILSIHGPGSTKEESLSRLCEGCTLTTQYCLGDNLIKTLSVKRRNEKFLYESKSISDCLLPGQEYSYISYTLTGDNWMLIEFDYAGMCCPNCCRNLVFLIMENGNLNVKEIDLTDKIFVNKDMTQGDKLVFTVSQYNKDQHGYNDIEIHAMDFWKYGLEILNKK